MEIKHRNGLFCIGMMTSLILAGAIYVTTVYRGMALLMYRYMYTAPFMYRGMS